MRLHLKKAAPCILPILLDRWSSVDKEQAAGKVAKSETAPFIQITKKVQALW
jgi:hypothetical protein